MSRPLILITNDDGFFAKGLLTLIELVKEFGDVVVVAPDKPQSAMSNAISLNKPLRYVFQKNEGNVAYYSCNGTPVDCTKLAFNVILDRKPDLLVSGINHGSNSSINVIYSGTMAAAMEGALKGVPSIGFSLLDHDLDANFDVCNGVVKTIIEKVLDKGMIKGCCLNVNIPKVDPDEIKGIRVCRQANANWEEEFNERVDLSGVKYYWLTGKFKNYDNLEDTDEWALANSYVSIVPVQYDLTNYAAKQDIENWGL
jgi:5'-nucleotidase